jgi:hypothetical protein
MEDGKFTVYAGKSVALAEVFKYTVGKEPILGPVICRLELSAPTEESTDGGRLAMQHVSIVPEGGGPTVVIGTAYQLDRLVELRSYASVADTYKKRFRTGSFPVTPNQYDEMTRRLKGFFDQFEFQFTVGEAPLPGARPMLGEAARGSAPDAARASGIAPARPTAAGTARPGTSARTARTAKRVPARDDIAADEATVPARSNKTIFVVLVAVLAAGAAALVAFFLLGK